MNPGLLSTTPRVTIKVSSGCVHMMLHSIRINQVVSLFLTVNWDLHSSSSVGVFKTISLRTHTKKDTSALDSFIAILEHHVARLVVHKGIAHDVTAALSLFEQSRKSNRVKEREAEERELRSPTTA